MHCDDILKQIGGFGRYQRLRYLLLCMAGVTGGFQALASIFTLYTPNYRCSLPADVWNGTDSYSNLSSEHSALVQSYIPLNPDGSMDSCNIYYYHESGNRTVESCSTWVYDRTERDSSVITSMNFVCDRSYLGTLASSMYMFGMLLGSFYSGMFADAFGRRVSFLVGGIGQMICGITLAFMPDFYSLAAIRFLDGMFSLQLFLSAFVIGMEICGPRYRTVAGIVIEIFWALGFCLMIGLAYGIRNEKYLQLTLSLVSIIYLGYYWIIPESPRWLLVKGRNKEAEEIFKKIAEVNGTTLPLSMGLEIEENKQTEKLKNILKAKTLLIRSIVVFINWFVVAFGYYGLSYNSGTMPGSLYVNTTFSAVGELIGYFLCFFCFTFGRKSIHIGAMILGGMACLASILVYYFFLDDEDAKNWIFVSLNTIGKIGVTMGFAIIYFWCAEIYPTLLRSSLMGISSTCARVGSILAPVIADIGKYVPPEHSQMVPPLIFGILTIAGGLSALALPETTGKDLPETIAEANIFPRKTEETTDEAGGDNHVKYEEDKL